MQIHEIKRKHKNHTKKRVGRGGARGDYSGRGMKGQGQHASSAPRPEIRDVIKKIPKKRGYRFNSIKKPYIVVNVGAINTVYKDNEKVTPKTLKEKKIIQTKKGQKGKIKVLGNGNIDKKLTILGLIVSVSAKEKIEKAGGSITIIETKKISQKK